MTIAGVRLTRPAEGWLTLALMVALALILAWAVDEPAWVNGKGDLTDVLVWCALGGLLFGFIGPKVGWGRWTTHLVGAVFAGLLIPILGGWTLLEGASPGRAFVYAAEGTIDAYMDIAWRFLRFTDQEVHYILVLGGVLWGTTQFAGYAVFGHRRPLAAVVAMGLVLVVNMGLTSIPQLAHLIAFSAAALFLLVEMRAFDERATWARRRIGDPSAISSLYLRGGTVFIVIALVGSVALTTRAASKPLEGMWDGLGNELISMGERISRFLPVGGALRPIGGVQFGQDAAIGDTWFTDDGIAFTANVPATEELLKWRAATYNDFALSGWTQSFRTDFRVEAGESLLAGTPEDPAPDQTRPIRVIVTPDSYAQGLLLAPGIPVTIDRPADVLVTGSEGWLAGVDLDRGPSRYIVDARILQLDDSQELVTGNLLELASTEYPAEIRALYTDVPEGAIGPDARDLLERILADAGTTNPYRLAQHMQDYFQSTSDFTYETDIRPYPCDADSAVECFARTTYGYCLHYASAMAILLREANPENPIPTRLVQGFLPGTRVGSIETVENRNAHAWVEVFFPGYGWIPFDPTGGGIGQPTVIVEGPDVVAPTPSPSTVPDDERGPDFTRRPDGDTGDSGAGITPPGGGAGDRLLLIVLTVLLAVVVIGVAVAAWLRGPRGDMTPDTAWQSMTRAASRFGFGPRPTQTVYEYSASLSELVPVARADLQTVADAKVETTYAGARLGGARIDAVRDATRRLRISLLRLVIRRPRKRGGR